MITIRMDISMHNHAVCIAVTYVTKKKTISLEKKPTSILGHSRVF